MFPSFVRQLRDSSRDVVSSRDVANIDRSQSVDLETSALTERSVISEISDGYESGGRSGSITSLRWGSALLGVVLIVGCVSVALSAGSSTPSEAGADTSVGLSADMTGRQLFESKALIEAATDTTMKTGMKAGVLEQADRQHVRSQMAVHFKDFGRRLAALSPEVATTLDTWKVSPTQRHVMETVMHNIGDPRVQGIGKDVARAIKKSQDAAESQEQTKARMLEALRAHIAEIKTIQDEVSGHLDEEAPARLLLVPAVVPTVAPFIPTLAPAFTTVTIGLPPAPTVNFKQQGQAFLAEAQAMLSTALMAVQISGMSRTMPDIALRFLQSGNYLTEFSRCLLENMNAMLMEMSCLVQLGAQGQSSIGILLSELGIKGEPFFPYTKGISIFENGNALTTAAPR